MNKKDLVKQVAEQANLSMTDAGNSVNAMIEAMTSTLANGDEVNLAGFMKLSRRRREARVGRNPKTGEQIEIAAAWVVKVVIGKMLKDSVNK